MNGIRFDHRSFRQAVYSYLAYVHIWPLVIQFRFDCIAYIVILICPLQLAIIKRD